VVAKMGVMAVGSAVAWGIAVGAAEGPHATTTAKTTVANAGITSRDFASGGRIAQVRILSMMFFMALFRKLQM